MFVNLLKDSLKHFRDRDVRVMCNLGSRENPEKKIQQEQNLSLMLLFAVQIPFPTRFKVHYINHKQTLSLSVGPILHPHFMKSTFISFSNPW